MAGEAALRAAGEASLEVGQVEVERHALVIQEELAADENQPLDADLQSAAPAAPDLRDVVAPRPERRGGERVDAQAQPLDPHAGEHDAVAAQRGEARPDAHDRHLQEGRRVLRDPRHPQAAQLDLGACPGGRRGPGPAPPA